MSQTHRPGRLTLRQFVAGKLPDAVTDYRDAAEAIAAAISYMDRDEYLIQAVMHVITDITGQRRRAAMDALEADMAPDATDPTGPGHKKRETHGLTAGSGGPTSREEQIDASRPARHRAALVAFYDAVGLAAGGGRKLIRHMTLADLRANEAYRLKLAHGHSSWAARFGELIAMVEAQGVDTVEQLVWPELAA